MKNKYWIDRYANRKNLTEETKTIQDFYWEWEEAHKEIGLLVMEMKKIKNKKDGLYIYCKQSIREWQGEIYYLEGKIKELS